MQYYSKTIRFGLMINSLILEKWQYDTVRILTDNGIQLALIIQNDDKIPSLPFLKKLRKYPYRRLIFRIWNRFMFKPKSKAAVNVADLIKNTPVILCEPLMKGISAYFKDADIQKIRNQNIDFILRFGFDIIRGEILNVPKYGVWSFHHDDERIIRGGPPGFWEFMRKIPCNGVILQRLTDKLDKGIVLKRICFNTILHSYKAHLDQLYFESEILPLQVCKDLMFTGKLNEEPSVSEVPVIHPPKNFKMLQYFWRCVWRRMVFHLKDLFRQEDWNVAYCFHPLTEFVKSDNREQLDIHWFKKPKRNCYFADPFVIKTLKDTYIFFEWYSYIEGKADLAVALKSEGFNKYHKISHFEKHCSYPYVFDYKNIVYCLPEANQTNALTLYRFDEEHLTLIKDTVLLEGFPIVDATLYYQDNKWFMFLVNQKHSHTHLEIYHSDNLRGPYLPHENNPVVIDGHDARPAGKIFELDGKQIRPSQDCTGHYGKAVTLEEIDLLTDKQFVTKHYSSISPIRNYCYDKGIHTLNGADAMTVFDGKRFIFTFAGLKQQLKQKFNNK